MRLTLTVLRCPPSVTPETRTVTGGEFTVGRGPGVDWVLEDPDQMVSRRHFTLEFRSGDWLLADGSANGTFANRDETPIGKGNKRTLRDHDRLRAGPYEIEVQLQEVETPSYGDPYDRSGPTSDSGMFQAHGNSHGHAAPMPTGFSSAIPDGAFDDPFDEAFKSLDAAPAFASSFGQQTQADHSSVLQDAMAPPMPMGQTPRLPSASIPDGNMLSDDWDKDLLEGISGAAPAPAAFVAPSPPPAAPLSEPSFTPQPDPATPSPVAPWPAVTDQIVPPPEPAPAPADPPLVAAFFAGVGLPDARPADPVATLQRLGEAFRAMVAGLRAVLIARASIKSEFRIEQTMIRAKGNNPLKFSADDDDAVTALLGVGRRIDMTPAVAVADALRDIRLHELASMAAMQAGVRAVLDNLHPDKVRATSEQGGGISVLPGQRKARAWDAYENLHTKTVQALSDDFDSVFGKAFARAYEDALDDLAAKERT